MATDALKESLHLYNPWWEATKVPPVLLREFSRPVINSLHSYLSLDRVIVLKGPRRTGKTTLFYQMVSDLLNRGTMPRDILFISLDDIKVRMDLDEIFKAYQEINKRLIKEGPPIYVFLDEVQFLDDWQYHVKRYFDRKYPMKFLVSGSSATLIKRGTESLAGRTVEETIYPFSFYEFLSYRLMGKEALIQRLNHLRESYIPFAGIDITDIIPHITEIKIVFEEYLEKGGFPNLFGIDEGLLWKRLVREDIVEKVIYRDLVELYDIKKPEVLEKLFLYLVDISSQILSVSNIANSLKLSREYAEKYLRYLEQALLIKRLKKFSKSIEGSLRSADKIHLLDSGLVHAFSRVEAGRVVESLVASHLIRFSRGRTYYFRDKYEVDLVFELDKEIFPIEVKYTDRISHRDLAGIFSFNRKFKPRASVIVTRDLLKEETSNGLRMLYVPAWLLSFLIG